MTDKLLPCPYCNGSDIRYSFKVKGTTYKQYHAVMYCNGCHAYGKRTLTDKIKWDNYTDRRNYEKDEKFRLNAITAWNTRVTHQALIEALEMHHKHALESGFGMQYMKTIMYEETKAALLAAKG